MPNESHNQPDFDAATHTYRVKGRIVPSVTQVIREAGLCDDSWWSPTDADRGTQVHAAIALWNRGVLDEASLDPAIRPYLEGWIACLRDNTWRVSQGEIERRHYHGYGYCGTVDCVVFDSFGRIVVDIKTGGSQPWHRIQLAAYQAFYPGARGQCVYLPGDGRYSLSPPEKDGNVMSVFLAALNIVNWRRANVPERRIHDDGTGRYTDDRPGTDGDRTAGE